MSELRKPPNGNHNWLCRLNYIYTPKDTVWRCQCDTFSKMLSYIRSNILSELPEKKKEIIGQSESYGFNECLKQVKEIVEGL